MHMQLAAQRKCRSLRHMSEHDLEAPKSIEITHEESRRWRTGVKFNAPTPYGTRRHHATK